jgi:hypothetical protein
MRCSCRRLHFKGDLRQFLREEVNETQRIGFPPLITVAVSTNSALELVEKTKAGTVTKTLS